MRPYAPFLVAVLSVALPALAGPGCVAAAVVVGAGAAFGVIKYMDNEAYRDFRTSMDATWSAAVASTREQGYPVSSDPAHGPSEGEFEAGDAKVIVERHPEDFTRVRVRIGTFESEDNKRRATLILEGVARRLE